MKKNVAFTLAEVLITLGIIGVVAAITMPTLISKYQKKVLETQYKKGISVISNGIQMMMAKEDAVGVLSNTTLNTCYLNNDKACFADVVNKYFKKVDTSDNSGFENKFNDIDYTSYLPIEMEINPFIPSAEAKPIISSDDYPSDPAVSCTSSLGFTNYKGETFNCPDGTTFNAEATTINVTFDGWVSDCCVAAPPTADSHYWRGATYSFLTQDGITIGFLETEKDGNGNILLYKMLMDVNGTKRPNKVDEDLFFISVGKTGVVK